MKSVIKKILRESDLDWIKDSFHYPLEDLIEPVKIIPNKNPKNEYHLKIEVRDGYGDLNSDIYTFNMDDFEDVKDFRFFIEVIKVLHNRYVHDSDEIDELLYGLENYDHYGHRYVIEMILMGSEEGVLLDYEIKYFDTSGVEYLMKIT